MSFLVVPQSFNRTFSNILSKVFGGWFSNDHLQFYCDGSSLDVKVRIFGLLIFHCGDSENYAGIVSDIGIL